MTSSQGTSLIVRSGEFEPRKWWQIFKVPAQLPVIGPGEQVVVGNGSGNYLAGSQLSEGVKAFGGLRTWHIVDCSPKTYNIPILDVFATPQYSLLATVTLRASVKQPIDVVRSGIRSLDDDLQPPVQQAIAVALQGFEPTSTDRGRAASIAADRSAVEGLLSDRLISKAQSQFPEWMDARVTQVHVTFEEADVTHVETFRRELRAAEILDAKALNDLKAAGHKVTIRELWRAQLSKELSNGSMAIFETVYDDPTPAKIAAALEKAETSERERLSAVFNVLTTAISKGLMVDAQSVADLQRELSRMQDGAGREVQPEILAAEVIEEDDDSDRPDDQKF